MKTEQSDAAVEEVSVPKKKIRTRRRRFRLGCLGLLVVLGVAAGIAFFVYGLRCERREYAAVLRTFSGPVRVTKGEAGSAIEPVPEMTLVAGDRVETGTAASAVLLFVDGSALQLAPNTDFTIRALEYKPGGRRTRSFWLERGQVISRVTRFFGADSRATICTPGAVAAVRGTGFLVGYASDTGKSKLLVGNGTVELQSGGHTAVCGEGKTVTATADGLSEVSPIPKEQRDLLGQALTRLAQYRYHQRKVLRYVDRGQGGAGWVATKKPLARRAHDAATAAVAQVRAVARKTGIARGSWNPKQADAKAVKKATAALETLRRRLDAAAAAETLPETLHPATLGELGLDDAERRAILEPLAGNILAGYMTTDTGYRVVAQAEDAAGTLLVLTPDGITQE